MMQSRWPSRPTSRSTPSSAGTAPYSKADVEKWQNNYHSKLAFLDQELVSRGLTREVERSHIVWAHDHRNEQYHGGQKGTPEKSVLVLTRKAALWVFSVLFDVPDAEQRLAHAVASSLPPSPPQPDPRFDRAIDREYGMVEVGDQTYHASELLFSVDYAAYREVGARLSSRDAPGAGEENKE